MRSSFLAFLYFLVSNRASGQHVDTRPTGFLHSISSASSADVSNASVPIVMSDSSETEQCVSRNIWDVTQGALSDLNDFKYDLESELAASAVLLGIVGGSMICLLFGGKLVKPCLFICAFLVGYYVGMSIVFLWQDWLSFDPCVVPLCIGVAVGVVAGFIAVSFFDKAVFLFGAAVGVVGALMLKQVIVSFEVHHQITKDYITTLLDWYWVVAIACGVLCGCLLRACEDRLLGIATILVGAWGLSISLVPLLALWGATVPTWTPLLTFVIAVVIGVLSQRPSR